MRGYHSNRSQSLRPFRYVTAALTFLLALMAPRPAAAADRYWSGLGANDLWSTPQNWNGNQVPQAGDELIFPAGGFEMVPINDLAPGTSFSHIHMADAYTLTGNWIIITGGIT